MDERQPRSGTFAPSREQRMARGLRASGGEWRANSRVVVRVEERFVPRDGESRDTADGIRCVVAKEGSRDATGGIELRR